MGVLIMTSTTPDPLGHAFPRELPLVGRKHELERLYQLFGHDTHVEPLTFLNGGAGVGKSRLAATLAAEAGRRGWTVVVGRAYPVETGMPYGLLSDAFLPLLRGLDEASLAVLTRGTSGDLRQLFPALGGEASAHDDWDPVEFRTRLFWSFSEFLKRLAERGPLLIVAEDLHWADESSLSLLHFVGRHLQGSSIRVLGTYSGDYGRDLDSLGRVNRSLTSLGHLRDLEVAPLDLEATEALLEEVFHVTGSPLKDFAGQLYDWTHGNPYFIEETLKTLVQSGRLYPSNGTWLGWEVRQIDLPNSVRDALLMRVGHLSDHARVAADLLAVAGGRSSVRLIGHVGDLSGESVAQAVEEVCARGIATEREEGSDILLELKHPMLREAIYQDLGPTRRQMLHRRLAEGLEQLHGDGAAPVDRLAFHFARAGPSGADPRAVRYLAEAGRAALKRHADREAVAYLQAALDRYPNRGASEQLPARPELEAKLARGLARLGRYAEAGATWAHLRAGAEAAHDRQALADADRHLGLNAFWSGRAEEALRHFDAALVTIENRAASPLEARLHLAGGVALQEMGRADEARGRIERSLEIARALDDPTLLGRAHRALALLFTWVGRADDARRHGWQAIELADEGGDDYVRFWGRWAIASLEGLTGHTEEMKRLMTEAGTIAEELRSPVLRLWTAELEIEYAYAVGDWDGALTQGERAIQFATSLGQKTLLPRLLVWTATVYFGRGDLERGRELVDRAWALAGLADGGERRGDVHVVVPAHLGAAACLLAEGRLDEAVAIAERGIELADEAGYVFWSLHLLLPIVGEAHLRARNLEGAAKIAERMRRDGEKVGHRLAMAWADTAEAVISWLSSDLDRGIELLRRAANALDDIPVRWEAARVRRQLAGRLAEVGRRDEALVELRRVHETFGDLGAQPELDKCRDMFRELDSRPPSRIEAQGTSELTPREVEVAVQVSRRLSNKGVAKALGVSPRTVTTHLSNIYRKLGIASRGELLDRVREGRIELH
jgi:tetratricopeptide (TPR) repeat protein